MKDYRKLIKDLGSKKNPPVCTKSEVIVGAVIVTAMIFVAVFLFSGCGRVGADANITEDMGAKYIEQHEKVTNWKEPSAEDTIYREIIINEPPFDEVGIESEHIENSE